MLQEKKFRWLVFVTWLFVFFFFFFFFFRFYLLRSINCALLGATVGLHSSEPFKEWGEEKGAWKCVSVV